VAARQGKLKNAALSIWLPLALGKRVVQDLPRAAKGKDYEQRQRKSEGGNSSSEPDATKRALGGQNTMREKPAYGSSGRNKNTNATQPPSQQN